MADAGIEDTAREIISKHVKMDASELTREITLESLNIESLDLVEIIFEIEDKFDVNIDEDEKSAKITNLGELLDWLTANIELQKSASN